MVLNGYQWVWPSSLVLPVCGLAQVQVILLFCNLETLTPILSANGYDLTRDLYDALHFSSTLPNSKYIYWTSDLPFLTFYTFSTKPFIIIFFICTCHRNVETVRNITFRSRAVCRPQKMLQLHEAVENSVCPFPPFCFYC